MKTVEECKKDIVQYAKLVYERNLVTAAGGNVSMRSGEAVVITASGVSLRDTAEDNLIVCDLEGRLIFCPEGLKPSKETILHLKVYRARTDVDSIIHVHPPYATGFSIAGRAIPIVTASAKMKVIDVPVAGYADPGSKELSQYVEETVLSAPQNIHAIVLKAHGIIAYEKGMPACFDTAELVEDTAHIAFIAETLAKE